MFKKIIVGLCIALAFTQAYASELKVKVEVDQKPRFWYNEESVHCLALNIYFEARVDHTAGQAAVADVVLNRVLHQDYPNTICEVIYEGPVSKWWKEKHGKDVPIRNRCQFSWYCDGKSDEPKENDAWQKAYDIALGMIVTDKYRGISEGATHYHATYVNPSWSKRLYLVGRIGHHIFYRK